MMCNPSRKKENVYVRCQLKFSSVYTYLIISLNPLRSYKTGYIYLSIICVLHTTIVCLVSIQRVASVVCVDLCFQHLYFLVYYSLSQIVCLRQELFLIE